jgi:hypothetical protein
MRSHDVAQVWSCFIESEHNEIDEPSATPLVLIGVALSSLSINNQGALFKIFGANYTSSFSLRIWQMSSLGDVVIDEARIQSMKRSFTFGGFATIQRAKFDS